MLVILFDGRCGLCKRTLKILHALDWLQRLHFQNYHDPDVRKRFAPDVPLTELHREMHAQLPDGRMMKGFTAFRAIAWNVPVFWMIAPLLYFPGVPWIGEKAYAFISLKRHFIV